MQINWAFEHPLHTFLRLQGTRLDALEFQKKKIHFLESIQTRCIWNSNKIVDRLMVSRSPFRLKDAELSGQKLDDNWVYFMPDFDVRRIEYHIDWHFGHEIHTIFVRHGRHGRNYEKWRNALTKKPTCLLTVLRTFYHLFFPFLCVQYHGLDKVLDEVVSRP